jgi:hypothetical protein
VAYSTAAARDQARENAGKLKKEDPLAKTLESYAAKLDKFHKTLVATRKGAGITGEEQLREKVVMLYGNINNYDGKPTASQLTRLTVLEKEIEKADGQFKSLIEKELPTIAKQLETRKLKPIKIMTEEEYIEQEG